MAKEKITSRPGWFGTTVHYDSSGRMVGKSCPGLFGSTIHYDKNGRRVGSSHPGIFGSKTHYDSKGRRVGWTTVSKKLKESGYTLTERRNNSRRCVVISI